MTRHDDAGDGTLSATEEALVTRLRALSSTVAVDPDEDYRAATRARLVAMAAVRTPAEAASRRPPARAGAVRRLLAGRETAGSRWRTRLTAGLAGAALTVTALGGLLGAAQGARPGDLLYGVKRGGEQTQLALAGDARGTTLLGFASTRLDELQRLVTAPSGAGPDVGLVLSTLQTMDQQTAEGTAALTSRAVAAPDPAALTRLSGWTTEQSAGLGTLTDAVPAGAGDALTAARDLVAQVATRATDLAAALGCAGGPSTAGADELGPQPAPCPAALPAVPGSSATDAPAVPSTGAGTPGPGAAGPGTTAPGPAAPVPSAAVPTAAAPSGGGLAPPVPAPGAPTGGSLPSAPPSAPGLPLPLPPLPLPLPTLSVPSLPLPPLLPAPTSTATPTPSPVISVPAPVPGVSVCLPPLVTVGC